MEIMTTSIQVLENRLKRNRMAGDPPDILIQPFCPQISTLDFHRAHAAIAAGQLAVEKDGRTYTLGAYRRLMYLYDHLSKF